MLHNVAWFSAVPQGLFVFIGICEFLGGIGLILPAMTGVKPKLTPFAAIGLTLVMILAAIFHIVRGESQLFRARQSGAGRSRGIHRVRAVDSHAYRGAVDQHPPHGYRGGGSGGSGSLRLCSGLVPDDAHALREFPSATSLVARR